MTFYVDALMRNGWQMQDRPVQSCPMFSNTQDHRELHAIAQTIGLTSAWIRSGSRTPHDNLTLGKRTQAVSAGAAPVEPSLTVRIWRAQASRAREERRA